jgi:hypothetical protein
VVPPPSSDNAISLALAQREPDSKSRGTRPARAGFLSNQFDWPASTQASLQPTIEAGPAMSPRSIESREGGACNQSIKQSVPLPPRSIQPSSFFLPVVPVFGSSIHRTLGIQFQGLPSLPTSVVQANSILSVPNQRNKLGSRKQREFCRTQTRVLGGIARSDVFW